ncbi:hypothetical protein QCA50_011431 [Cerrena zonata]|uniref:Uncharacterized protein n=1 Tax=Cerrena zonata TaxID=2478898 RepID=A0AAW0G2L3_9APHY
MSTSEPSEIQQEIFDAYSRLYVENYCIVASSIDTTASALVLASDCFLLIVTWVKTVGIRRKSMRLGVYTPLVSLLLRDGTLYFGAILIVQILAIVSSQVGSNFILWDVWIYFSHVITIIFLSRFMLNLRGVYLKTEPGDTSQSYILSDPRFAENLVGNLGAPLYTSYVVHGRLFRN